MSAAAPAKKFPTKKLTTSKRRYLQSSAHTQNNKKKKISRKGIAGILATCDLGKEKTCARELLNWLIEYADQHYPRTADTVIDQDSDDDDDDTNNNSNNNQKEAGMSVSDALAAELAEIKAEARGDGKQKGRFGALPMKINGTVLIHIKDRSIDPVNLVIGLMESIRTTKQMQTRHTVRLIPIHNTCFPSITDIQNMAQAMINQKLYHFPPGKTFIVECSRRGAQTLERDAIIRSIADLVDKDKYSVSLKTPDIIVHIEVIENLATLAVYEARPDLFKFNIRSIWEQAAGLKYVAPKRIKPDSSGDEQEEEAQETDSTSITPEQGKSKSDASKPSSETT